MGRRSNFNDTPDPSHCSSNFERRLKKTMNSELEPEHVSPQTAGEEEMPEYTVNFPLVRQFHQTNMFGKVGSIRSSDEQTNPSGSDEEHEA